MSYQKKEELIQKNFYNRIAEDYDRHYNDKWNLYYLNRCIVPFLFKDLKLKDSVILDGLCGSGLLTSYLINQDCKKIIGLDISQAQLSIYQRKFPDCQTICSSITNASIDSNSLDVICIFGGLHHVHPYFKDTIEELYRLLKPGGSLCFYEPQTHTILESLRRFWYRHDSEFNENEGAIDIDKFIRDFSSKFDVLSINYVGTLAHFFVLNSKILRIPHWIKHLYSYIFIQLEWLISFFPIKYIASNAVVQLKKKNLSD